MVRRTKEEALETRNRILDAAEAVFQIKGVSRASLADIAAEAGVTRGAIYWHFTDKAALFAAMIRRVVAPLETYFEEQRGYCGEACPGTWLRETALTVLDRIASDERFFRVFEIAWHKCEYVGEMAQIRATCLEASDRHISMMECAFARMAASGDLRKDITPRQAAVGLVALVDGLICNWTLDTSLFPLKELAPGLVDTYLRGLRA